MTFHIKKMFFFFFLPLYISITYQVWHHRWNDSTVGSEKNLKIVAIQRSSAHDFTAFVFFRVEKLSAELK